ncbi:MAG: ribosome small subunit-dependent GTPase A [Lentisphaeraceae bacterium]|nr:ribosome small subunit-dependent GTPase A [Lentisphaeraceae bacterium]
MGKKSKKKKRSLENLSESEKAELYSRGAKLRKAAVNKNSSKDQWKQKARKGDWGDEASQEKFTGKGPESLDAWAAKAFSKADQMGIFDKNVESRNLNEGVIVTISRQGGELLFEDKIYDFMLKPEIMIMQKTELAVGERVLFSFDNEDHCLVEQPLERTQILSRPDPTRRDVERVIAVNMDVIIITSALENPTLNYNLIDRFLIGVEQSAAQPIICINKIDLLNDGNQQLLDNLSIYDDLGVKVIKCSADTGEGIDELVEFLGGKTCVFLGTSGVGKSSLLNCIDPELNLKTAENREKAAGRGRHTTVMAQMYKINGGIKLIDTPGVREFNFVDLEKNEVQYGFKEFIEHMPCKFNNCLHDQEKGCNVIQAVEAGEIPESRYDSYVKILHTLDVKRLPPKQRDNLLF